MIYFWLAYVVLSFIISFSILKILNDSLLGFCLSMSLFGAFISFWFIQPGNQEISPILSILFLESTIIESNGYLRLIRPLLLFSLTGGLIGIISFFIKKKKS